MKKIKILGLLILTIIGFTSCEDDDNLIFTALEPSENVMFTSTFLSEYILTSQTQNNIAERFVWNSPDFGVATPASYDLEGSATEDFAEVTLLGTTQETNFGVTVSQMLELAELAGLDNDPNTADMPNEGSLYFRVRAYVGDGGSNAPESYSDVMTINVVLPEDVSGSGFQISTWGVVGSGYNNWGAYADSPFYTTSQNNVLVAYVTLYDGEIKFRENNEWTNDFGDDGADGTLDPGGANIAVTAGNYKITLNLNDNTYTIEEFSWGVVGSGYNNWGADGPDAKFYYDYTTDTFKAGVRLVDGEIKFRMNNTWDQDFGDTGADGTLDAGGDNIAVTEGHYAITLDFNAGTYTIEEANLWGVVGSGYNDWGGDGPDFTFTQVQPDVWVAEIVPLVDGEIKFRINNAWDQDFGDDDADGTLDAGGANIVVTAGSYRIYLDIANGTYSIN